MKCICTWYVGSGSRNGLRNKLIPVDEEGFRSVAYLPIK